VRFSYLDGANIPGPIFTDAICSDEGCSATCFHGCFLDQRYRRYGKEVYHAEKVENKNERNNLSPSIREVIAESAITKYRDQFNRGYIN